MKSGYDNFFKEVKKNAAKERPADPIISTKRPVIRRKQMVRAKFPTQLIITLTVGLTLTGLAWWKQEALLKTWDSFEVQLFGRAIAEEKPEAKPKTEEKDAKKSEERHPESTDPAYLKKMVERKKELDTREAELNKAEEELEQQKVALDERIKQLEKIREQIAETLKDKVVVDNERVDKLVEFYSNMKPQQAAKIIETLNEDLAVETLGRMKKKNAADIMNLLEAKKAQSISEKFAGYRRK